MPSGARMRASLGQPAMADLTSHPNILRSWLEWEIDGRERRLILVVETDIEMRPEADDFDEALMDEVRTAAIAEMRAVPSALNLIRIVPAHP
jgi:hypothetical protein